MNDTLYAIYQDFWRDRQFHEKYSLPLDDRLQQSVGESEAELIGQFYEANPLAEQVAKGETSYMQSIRPILDMYGGLVQKMFAFRKNEDVDEQIRDVVDSMNQVGVRVEANAKRYTTADIRRWWAIMEGFFSFLGVSLGSSLAVTYLSIYSSYKSDSGEPHSLGLGVLSTVVVLTLATSALYGMGKAMQIFVVNQSLRDLKALAKTNDKFLRDPEEFLRNASI